MEYDISENVPEEPVSTPEHDPPQTSWTDEDSEEEEDGAWEDELKGSFDFAAEYTLDLEGPEWGVSESRDMEVDARGRSKVDSTRMFKLRKNLDQLDSFYKQKELNVLKAREELKACLLHLAELEEERDSLEIDIEREKQAENSVAVFRLRTQHKRLCAQLQGEEELEAHLTMVLQEHELELCEVEVELGRFLGLRHKVEQEENLFQAQKQEKYNQRIQREKDVARGVRLRELRAKNKQEKFLREQAQLDQKRREQALTSRRKAVVFLKQSLSRMRQKETEREEKRKEIMKRRMEAATSLKANIAASQETLRVRQAKEKARLQKLKQDEKRQKESLQTAGMNSIKIMYLQKAQEDLYRKQEEFRERLKARRLEIESKLLLEKEEKEKQEKRRVIFFPPVTQSMALKQREQRLLRSILPPSPPAAKREILTKRPASSPAISRSNFSSSSDSEKDERRNEVEEAVEEAGGEGECLVQPEFSGLWDRKHSDYTSTTDEDTPLKIPHLKSMKTVQDKSLASKAARIAAVGKELKGPPFVSKPEIIFFKDFDVGKTYKKKVVLTNISHNTNYCRLLGVSQNLMDFISVRFEPPGPMSAGMACELEAVFRPMVNENLDGEIQFQSAAGPFSVIVKCTKKKCEMVVESSLIDFGTHVVGQTISRVITLINRGALGTRYTLTPHSMDFLQLHHLSKHSVSAQVHGEGSSVDVVASSHIPEDIQPKREVAECITESDIQSGLAPTTDPSSDVEVKEVEQISGGDDLEERVITGVNQGFSSDISEICIGKVHEGEVGPFSSVKLPIIFRPVVPGETKVDFQITFSQPDCEAIVVSARGTAESVPVWVTTPNMDLRICMYDRLYQDSIEIQSRANTALKVKFEVCKELKNHMDILPKTGFIQAKSSFHAQLKFLPRRSLPEDAKSLFDQDTGVLEVPLYIQVAGQVKPVPFTVHAVVTTSDLEFDHTEVDFGHCSVFESVVSTVRLTNCSLLPQDFGFVSIPSFIDVQPNDGFGTLLPLQTVEIDLIFSASKAGEYKFQLTCKSGINRDFVLSCHGIGVRPLLELSDSVVQFGGTAVGDHSTAVLYVVNSHTSRNEFTHAVPRIGKGPIPPVEPRFFYFSTPQNSEITVTPASGRVLPGQRILVQVTFSPSLCEDDIRAEAVRLMCCREDLRLQKLEKSSAETRHSKSAEHETLNKKEMQQDAKKGNKPPTNRDSAKQSLKEKGSKTSLSPKSDSPFQPLNPADIQKGSDEFYAGKASLLCSFKERYSRYIIPCFVSNGDVTPRESEVSKYSPFNTLYLELHCPAVRPALVVISDHGETIINFNQVAIDQKVVKKVTIQNISSESVNLKSSLLDLNGPFCVLNALREVRPGDTHTLLLAFTPALAKKYREILEVSCSKMALELTLCGEGLQPLVTCSHEGEVMNFGYVLEKESSTQVFKLQNSSSLMVQFSVLLDSLSLSKHGNTHVLPAFLSTHSTPHNTVGTQNYSGQSVFSVSPTEGAIGPGKTQDITVTFRPDHESLHYRDTLKVGLMNKQTVCVLELRGSARCHTMFVCGGDVLDVSCESLIPNHIYSTGETQHTESEKSPTPLLLTLKSMCGESGVTAAVRELEVGCIRTTQPVSKKNVEFLWENVVTLQQHGFSVDPTKGSVDPGTKRTITVTWMPLAGHTPNDVVQVCVPLILKGDDTEVYSVTFLANTSNKTDS
ncbi:cilia- and flagella-associated protein 74 isoform X2 [Hoplias malabaricus]|uniref:cilia- and flagella-associated protein 74 isoform X2 n=1 Tax=Hoplias malabaricus TaxID=27720 RepID=UPI0034626354